MKKIVTLLLILVSILSAKKVVAEGLAQLGNGVTLEKCKELAINDARKNAISALGVFIESKTTVVNQVLTTDEITAITGAIVKMQVMEETKDVQGDVFVLKVKAAFKIDDAAFDRALNSYRQNSDNSKIVQSLTATIQQLQKELMNSNRSGLELVNILDEITFNNTRLNKLLTTKDKIDQELDFQRFYKMQIKENFLNEGIASFTEKLRSQISFFEVPEQVKGALLLKFSGKNIKPFKYGFMDQKAAEYNKSGQKLKPLLNYEIKMKFPVALNINEKSYTDSYILMKMTNSSSQTDLYSRKANGEYQIFSLDSAAGSAYLNIDMYVELKDIKDISVYLKAAVRADIMAFDEIIYSTENDFRYRDVNLRPRFGDK